MAGLDDVVVAGAMGPDGEEAVEYTPQRGNDEPESNEEAAEQGPDKQALFWQRQISTALLQERRWRGEAEHAEDLYFGPDEDSGQRDGDSAKANNQISETTSTIHGNIDVLKPLLFSETPTPIVQRRFKGDGKKTDQTDLMATEVGQRLAQWILSTTRFDEAMEGVRDDWLISGRGAARAFYKAQFTKSQEPDPLTGTMVDVEKKTSESVYASHWEWRRLLLAAGHSWDRMPWCGFEVPMVRSGIEKAFPKYADKMRYNRKGLIDRSRAIGNSDRNSSDALDDLTTSGELTNGPFDTATVWEIWIKESRKVIWWSPDCPTVILDEVDDPLNLEDFWPMPKPVLASSKGTSMNPRPDVRYYEAAAEEVELATQKLKGLLNVVAVTGLYPGNAEDEIKKLTKGVHGLFPVQSWAALMDKGGTRELIQWLPLDTIGTCITILSNMRESAKQRMFEGSGVSDIMRAQGDPRETATAQNLKGKYAGMRLSSRQRKMALYVRDMLRIMVEIGVEMFDTAFLADICNLDLPLTEQERAAMQEQQDAQQQQFEALMQQYAAMQASQQAAQAQVAQYAQASGGQPAPMAAAPQLPPPPEPPVFDKIPETSWELVHERLRNDLSRKITITIETQSTILADEQDDKEARIEFLGAFAKFVQEIMPLVGSGQFDMKTAKELLLFGVRAFPKSRTLEGMISELPDEAPQKEQVPDVQVQVAKIRAEVDLQIEEIQSKDRAADRELEAKVKVGMKGADLMAKAADHQAAEQAEPAGED